MNRAGRWFASESPKFTTHRGDVRRTLDNGMSNGRSNGRSETAAGRLPKPHRGCVVSPRAHSRGEPASLRLGPSSTEERCATLAERRPSAPTLREKRSPSGNEHVGKRLEDLGVRDRPIGAGGDEGAVDRRQREPRHPVDDAAAGVVVARDGDLSPESREGEFADVAHGFGYRLRAAVARASSRQLGGPGLDETRSQVKTFGPTRLSRTGPC